MQYQIVDVLGRVLEQGTLKPEQLNLEIQLDHKGLVYFKLAHENKVITKPVVII